MKLISSWVLHGIFDEWNGFKELTETLVNAIHDFDWETWHACFEVISAVVLRSKTECLHFILGIFNDVIMRGLSDTEYKVREKTLRCMNEIVI